MKPINIYQLTRIQNASLIQKLERQMSARKTFLSVKEWEMDGLRKLAERCKSIDPELTHCAFYYSFLLPKLGKEFDLLRISDAYVVNIELKSRDVSNEAIRGQLLQNRHYLSLLGLPIHSYTYISEEDRLVRLSRSGKLVDTDWNRLCKDLLTQTQCYEGDIEDLFKEYKYLISPLTDPDKFLRKEYFLTYQQRDIKKQILQKAAQKVCSYQGFTGFPGTGKTLLLYDMALQLSWRERVCILHFGAWSQELEQLDRRLKRMDFINCMDGKLPCIEKAYAAVCVDEAHWMTRDALGIVAEYAQTHQVPVIFSYDTEDAIAAKERKKAGTKWIEELEGFTKYRLTNRIRVNRELSSFIHRLMQLPRVVHRDQYPSIHLNYANNWEEVRLFLEYYRQQGYIYIRDERIDACAKDTKEMKDIEVRRAACKEFESVVMLMDESFYYTERGYLLVDGDEEETNSRVRCLFHGLSRAKQQVAVIVKGNLLVFEKILQLLQKNG